MTAAALMLERFGSAAGEASLPEYYDAADLEAARGEGEAAGRRAAEAAGLATLAAAVNGLAVALGDDDTRRAAIRDAARQMVADLAGAITAALVPAFRAELVAASLMALLDEELLSAPASPPSIGCEPATQPILRAALDAAGLQRVRIATIASGAEIVSTGGVLRIDFDRLRAALDQTILEIKENAA